jgi:molecular chaperone Hsp33
MDTPEAAIPLGDHVLRAMTEDDNFRVITANTTDSVRGAIAAQRVTDPTIVRHFADLLTGIMLIRETMSPGHRVQAILRGTHERASLIADSHPDGLTRGLVQIPDGATFELGEGSQLQVMRSMARGVHKSVVAPPPNGDVSQALMTYTQESEQIVTMIATGTLLDGNSIQRAGGFVVQLLPGAARGPLMIMTERLEGFPPIAELLGQVDGSPSQLMAELLYQMPFTQLAASPLRFGCKCSREAVVSSLATLSREELSEMIGDGIIEVTCDYCGTDYAVGRQHLEGLLNPS